MYLISELATGFGSFLGLGGDFLSCSKLAQQVSLQK
jgi:hypothetical protein